MPRRKRRYTLTDGERWKAMYEADDVVTFEQIALDEGDGTGTGTVRYWAIKAGVTARSPNRPRGPQRPSPIYDPPTASGPAIRTGVVLRATRRQGKRRRSL